VRIYICRVLDLRHTTNVSFAVCPKSDTRQTFRHTANVRFPSVPRSFTRINLAPPISCRPAGGGQGQGARRRRACECEGCGFASIRPSARGARVMRDGRVQRARPAGQLASLHVTLVATGEVVSPVASVAKLPSLLSYVACWSLMPPFSVVARSPPGPPWNCRPLIDRVVLQGGYH